MVATCKNIHLSISVIYDTFEIFLFRHACSYYLTVPFTVGIDCTSLKCGKTAEKGLLGRLPPTVTSDVEIDVKTER